MIGTSEFGLQLRDHPRRDQWWEQGQNLYLDNLKKKAFAKSRRGAATRRCFVDNLQSPVPNHAAIYLGDQQVLHHVQGRLLAETFTGYCGRTLPAP